jgi:DNA-binding NarL/FixJ family response regulator
MSLYVIEDHPLMRDAVVAVLRRLRPTEPVIGLTRFGELDAAVQQHGAPRLVCLDLTLPDATGISAVVLLKRRYPDASMVVYSGSPAAQMAEACVQAGANIYIEKSASPAALTVALHSLLTANADSDELETTTIHTFSKRQRQLIILLDQGLSNQDIAAGLHISEHTVKVHLWRLFRRLRVKSRTQLLHYLRGHGLLLG